MSFALYLAPEAETDIDDVLEWSVERFGPKVRDGYEELINTAIDEVLADPEHPGTHVRPELGQGIHVVHLMSSRDHVGPEVRRTLTPRHFVVYWQVGGTIQIVRVLHDAMELPRHLVRYT